MIDVDCVGPSEMNRDTNIQYVHTGVGAGIKQDEFDPERASAGYVIRLKGQARIEAFQAFYRKLSLTAPELYPPMLKDKMTMPCLSANHLTLCLRGFKHNVKDLIPNPDDKDLGLKITNGHKYYVFKEDIPAEAMLLVSEWENSDNNQNSGTNEAALMRTVKRCVLEIMRKNSSGQIKIVDVIAAVTAESIVKIRPENISTMTTLCLDLGVKGYVEEWLKWHGSHINPCELKAVIGWFGELNSLVDKKRPLTRLNIMKVHYNAETAQKI